jgi:uncharacterized membrane-anchored protein
MAISNASSIHMLLLVVKNIRFNYGVDIFFVGQEQGEGFFCFM